MSPQAHSADLLSYWPGRHCLSSNETLSLRSASNLAQALPVRVPATPVLDLHVGGAPRLAPCVERVEFLSPAWELSGGLGGGAVWVRLAGSKRLLSLKVRIKESSFLNKMMAAPNFSAFINFVLS